MPRIKTRDAEATKEAILRAAERLFANNGFAGTPLREISEASGASGPLIVFHFKSKRGLYKAVKASIMRRFFAARDETPLPEKPFDAFIEHVLRAMFRFYRENPAMMRLATWDRLEGDVDPWPEEDEWHHTFWDRIRRAQQDGEIRDDLTPLNISIMICGAVHIWWEYH
jgi:TetR/AcrR family transcriptional regulator